MFKCLAKCLGERTLRPATESKADVGLEEKIVPVQANLHPTYCSNFKPIASENPDSSEPSALTVVR